MLIDATTRNGEYARYARVSHLNGVEVFAARFVSHQYGPHSHDTWAIGSMARGARDQAARSGQHCVVKAGELSAIPPGEVHAGRPVDDVDSGEYAMLYIEDKEFRLHAADLGLATLEPSMTALSDARLAGQLQSFVRLAMRADGEPLAIQTEWCALMTAMLARYAGTDLVEPRPACNHLGLMRALSFIHEFWDRPISLNRLAREADMSATSFCRLFARTHGLPPHRYQLVLRVTRAKDMLIRGDSVADVAAATGFSDQSHLGRQLKNCLGVTPGQFAGLACVPRTFYPPPRTGMHASWR